MSGLFSVWQAMPVRNKIISLLAVIATVFAFGLLVEKGSRPKLALLYSGLEASTAGDVIAEVEKLGIAYDVRGATIYVDERRRDSLRLELARQGLPRQGEAGYELLDNLNSFATTSEMFDAAYWRAKEGELARTIGTTPGIRGVRVHIGASRKSSFSRSGPPRTASVTLSSISGIGQPQAKAIQYVTALSVPGLLPQDVAVIDTTHGVLVGPGAENIMENGMLGSQTQAKSMEQNLLNLLEAHVGIGNARVNVSMAFDMDRRAVTQRIFDPEQRVLKSRTTTENNEESSGTEPNVTVASNLPEGEAGSSANNSSRTDATENATYEISETLTEQETLPGAVKKLSIAVLLNHTMSTDANGEVVTTPRSVDEIEKLQNLITAAAGIDADRGDVITVETLSFAEIPAIEDAPQPGLLDQFLQTYLWSTVQAVFIGIVALVLGLFVVKPILTQHPLQNDPLQLANNTEESGQGVQTLSATTVEDSLAQLPQDPFHALRIIASEKSDETASLLTLWLDEPLRIDEPKRVAS